MRCIDVVFELKYTSKTIHHRQQLEYVVLLFIDDANTVSKELNQWRAALTDHERQFHNWKKIWVGVHTAEHHHLNEDLLNQRTVFNPDEC